MKFYEAFSIGVLPVCFFVACAAPQQPEAMEFAVGGEVQVYPTGNMIGFQGQWPFDDNDVLTLRLAYNTTDRGDNGEQDHEEGGGPGFGYGFRRYFGENYSGWLLGGRLDFWRLDIDWRNDRPGGGVRTGNTKTWVAQPTVEGGYAFALGDSRWKLDLTVAFGFEINFSRAGQRVGEGPILLGGAALSYGF